MPPIAALGAAGRPLTRARDACARARRAFPVGKASAVAIAAFSLVLPLHAGAGGGAVLVRAVVVKHARLTLLSQPSTFVITPDDITRGYIDCAVPTELAVRGNSPDGYEIGFASTGEYVSAAAVKGLSRPVRIGARGGAAVLPAAAPRQTSVLKLAYRFELAPNARSGVYEWPIKVSITPL